MRNRPMRLVQSGMGHTRYGGAVRPVVSVNTTEPELDNTPWAQSNAAAV